MNDVEKSQRMHRQAETRDEMAAIGTGDNLNLSVAFPTATCDKTESPRSMLVTVVDWKSAKDNTFAYPGSCQYRHQLVQESYLLVR